MESLPSRRQALVAAATARVLSHFYVDEIYLPSTPRQELLAIVLEIVSSQGSRCICIYTMLIRCEPRFVPFLSLLDLLNQVIVNLTKVTAIHFSYSPPFIRSHPFVPVFQEVFLEHLTKDIYTTIHSLKHNISYFHAFFRVICTGFET